MHSHPQNLVSILDDNIDAIGRTGFVTNSDVMDVWNSPSCTMYSVGVLIPHIAIHTILSMYPALGRPWLPEGDVARHWNHYYCDV